MHRNRIILLPPNRVWRSYQGGRLLDQLGGSSQPVDSHYPEDWIASITQASNPNSTAAREGVSRVAIGDASIDLSELIGRDPEYFLGAPHVTRFGPDPKVLVKFIDSAIRLHFQVHPTTEFARTRLGAPAGKTEAYHVLAVRPDVADPCIYIGFRSVPSRDELKRMIETQEIEAMKRCLNRIPVRPGDTYLVPGGVPHALGEGLFLVEIQEPSDLVVRFEFERGGYVLPESARFMNRGLDFCLDIFDLSPHPVENLRLAQPRELARYSANSWREELIGPSQTPSFRLARSMAGDSVQRNEREFAICIVTGGRGTVSAGQKSIGVSQYEKFLLPAGLGPVTLTPDDGQVLEILECLPP